MSYDRARELLEVSLSGSSAPISLFWPRRVLPDHPAIGDDQTRF